MVNANCNSTVDTQKGTATQTTLKLEIKSQKRTKAERRKKTYTQIQNNLKMEIGTYILITT